MESVTTCTLDVPGARLRYETRGSGPVLLLIPGGWGNAAMFTSLAPLLTDAYTVVTYDPRGLSRSTLGLALISQQGYRTSFGAAGGFAVAGTAVALALLRTAGPTDRAPAHRPRAVSRRW